MKKYLSIGLATFLVLVGLAAVKNVSADVAAVTTVDATSITTSDATLNGTNGPTDATGHSFWVSTSTFSTASPTVPDGVYSTVDFLTIASSTNFSAQLSSATGLPSVTSGTTYYFVAWSNVGGVWTPGEILNFTTTPISTPDTTPPSTPVNLSPANDAALTSSALTEINWSTSTDASSSPVIYVFQSSHATSTNLDGSFATPVFSSGVLTENKIVTAGTPEGIYYWHVKAVDNVGNVSPWTDAWKITVDNSLPAPLSGTLAAEDFGVMDVSGVKGYTAGFGLTDATFASSTSVVVKLYAAGDQLLQTNTLSGPNANLITGTEISSPFDVFGTLNYVTDGYWTNVRAGEYGQTLIPVKVVMTVTLANGKIVTATNTTLTGDEKILFPLGGAVNFTILSQTGITDTGSHNASITGNIGSSAITSAAISVFCSEINGKIYGVDAAYVGSGNQTCFNGNPPLSNKTLVDNAVGDMVTEYNNLAGMTGPTATELGAGNIGGMTLAPGLYKWSTDVNIPTNVTLSGGANDTWIFQIAGNLNIASAGSVPSGIKVILSGGAKASNISWQVGGATGATLGTYSTFNGTILSAKQIILQTGAVLNGRALAQTQVTLDGNIVSVPDGVEQFVLAYVAGDNGTITGTSTQIVDQGLSGGAITAIPNPSYHFVNWSDGSTANPRIDTNVSADVNVTANFVKNGDESNNNNNNNGGGHGSSGYGYGFGRDNNSSSGSQGKVLGASFFKFSKYLSQGMSIEDVMELQERLRAEGFFTFKTSTGYFGPITFGAVKAY